MSDIKKLCRLSRITVNEDEEKAFSESMDSLIRAADKLQSAQENGEEDERPFTPLRSDEPEERENESRYYTVKRII